MKKKIKVLNYDNFVDYIIMYIIIGIILYICIEDNVSVLSIILYTDSIFVYIICIEYTYNKYNKY